MNMNLQVLPSIIGISPKSVDYFRSELNLLVDETGLPVDERTPEELDNLVDSDTGLQVTVTGILKNTVMENKFSSQCVFRRINEIIPEVKITQVGIRSLSNEEASWLETNNPNIEIYFARDKNRWNVADLLTNLSKNVYISFNFNVLDPGVIPSSTIPEPAGFGFEQACDIIKNICAFKEIVGMDFVELSPIANLSAPDFTAAKLIYKSIGYSFARELGAFEEEVPELVTNS